MRTSFLYTTATDLISADAESTTYYVTKDARTSDHTIVKADASTAYIAIDFVKQYSDFDYTVYDQPNRVVLTNQWGDYNTAPVKKSTEPALSGRHQESNSRRPCKRNRAHGFRAGRDLDEGDDGGRHHRLCKDQSPRQHLHRDPDQRLHCGRIFAY